MQQFLPMAGKLGACFAPRCDVHVTVCLHRESCGTTVGAITGTVAQKLVQWCFEPDLPHAVPLWSYLS